MSKQIHCGRYLEMCNIPHEQVTEWNTAYILIPVTITDIIPYFPVLTNFQMREPKNYLAWRGPPEVGWPDLLLSTGPAYTRLMLSFLISLSLRRNIKLTQDKLMQCLQSKVNEEPPAHCREINLLGFVMVISDMSVCLLDVDGKQAVPVTVPCQSLVHAHTVTYNQ